MIDEAEHLRLVHAKHDLSWQRYYDGAVDVVDRYNLTAALCQGKNILDIGCGQGLLASILLHINLDAWLNIVGIDLNAEIIQEARGRVGQDHCVNFYVMDAESLNFDDVSFDTVVLGQVLEHVRHPALVACEAMRVLRPGGRLIVNVPADDKEPHGNHLHVFNLAEMKALFSGIKWQGEGRIHRYWFAWGCKND